MTARNYESIQRKISALQAQADRIREKEKTGVIARIREAIGVYGITAAELFGASHGAPLRKSATVGKRKALARYSDGNGNEWSGRGPRPRWLREALEAGKSLEDYLGGSAAAPSGSRRRRKAAKGYKVAVKFRDAAGNSWSGRGSQPRWLRDALAAGKKPQDFAV
jgi:DNA-binding protein H-NS